MPWEHGVLESRRAVGVASLLYLVVYLLAAAWAVEFSLPDSVLVWFPPAGVAIGLFYFGGWRLLPAAILAELLSTLYVTDFADAFGPFWLAVNSIVLPLAYLIGAWVLQMLDLDPRLRSLRDMGIMALGALLVGPILASVVGITVQVLADIIAADDALADAGRFLVGDVVGVAGVTPTLLVIGAAYREHRPLPLSDRREPDGWVFVELLIPSIAAVALLGLGEQPFQFVYLVFVPVALVAMRHGVAGAALSTAGLAAVLTVGADLETTITVQRTDFQALLGVIVVTGVLLGSIVSERHDQLVHHRMLSEIVEATPDLVGTARADGTITYLNPRGRHLLGLTPGVGQPPPQVSDFFADELSRELLSEAMRTADRSGAWYGTNTVRTEDGRLIAVSQTVVSHGYAEEDRVYSTVLRDITDQRRLEEQLRRSAVRDDATGLANRVLLVEQLEQALATADRRHELAILHVDIDRFRIVNETFGYEIGDQVVATIARRLQAAVRPQDLVARYSGGLFAVVLTHLADEYTATDVAERILECAREPITLVEPALVLSVSIGGVIVLPGEGDAQDALRRAEIAMHRSKEEGGDRIALFDPEMDRRSRERMELEADLREVIESGEWWLAYQPIIDADHREVVSCEALLRWTHPTRGPVSPLQLVLLAEATGLIVPLGHQILDRACRQARTWQDRGLDLRVAVNVSRSQLEADGFVEDVAGVIEGTGVDPSHLVLEITETALAADVSAIASVLHQLRAFGCHIAMDDFGTGYSSLGSLRDLPIDVLKLDRTFITDLPDSERATAAVDAVIRLAERLDLMVVAEGVEDQQQLETLCDLGCDRIQGYAVAYPLPVEEFDRMMARAATGVDPHPIVVSGPSPPST
jgi:diguanylate cyclase (GGDEF)-like protein/PAS domain S-box-containing protein